MRTPPRILIVDDNPTNVKVLQTRLLAEGYEIVTAADGEEGLAAAREQTPDLILLDIMMPKIDGVEVCRRGYVVICPDRMGFESRSLTRSRFRETFERYGLRTAS